MNLLQKFLKHLSQLRANVTRKDIKVAHPVHVQRSGGPSSATTSRVYERIPKIRRLLTVISTVGMRFRSLWCIPSSLG